MKLLNLKLFLKIIIMYLLYLTCFSCRTMPVVEIDGKTEVSMFNCEISVFTKDTLWINMTFEQIKEKYKKNIRRGGRACRCDTIYLITDKNENEKYNLPYDIIPGYCNSAPK